MHKSTEDTIYPIADTIGEIKLAIKSRSGEETVFCIVEGPNDEEVYKKFLNDKVVQVKPSSDDTGEAGWERVSPIVNALNEEEPECCIFGICDRDYTVYDSAYVCPQNVYQTDHRDIDMMMLAAPSVSAGLNKLDSKFPAAIMDCVVVIRYLGYLRIYHYVKKFSKSIKKKLKSPIAWCQKAHSLYENWKCRALSKFLAILSAEGASEGDFKNFVIQNNLLKESCLDVCRGHDFLRLLGNMVENINYNSEDKIRHQMIDLYSLEDFKATKLYQSIKQWADSKGVTVLLD